MVVEGDKVKVKAQKSESEVKINRIIIQCDSSMKKMYAIIEQCLSYVENPWEFKDFELKVHDTFAPSCENKLIG